MEWMVFKRLNQAPNMNIAEIKQKYGDRLTLIGNVDCSTVLVDGPKEAVNGKLKLSFRQLLPVVVF